MFCSFSACPSSFCPSSVCPSSFFSSSFFSSSFCRSPAALLSSSLLSSSPSLPVPSLSSSPSSALFWASFSSASWSSCAVGLEYLKMANLRSSAFCACFTIWSSVSKRPHLYLLAITFSSCIFFHFLCLSTEAALVSSNSGSLSVDISVDSELGVSLGGFNKASNKLSAFSFHRRKARPAGPSQGRRKFSSRAFFRPSSMILFFSFLPYRSIKAIFCSSNTNGFSFFTLTVKARRLTSISLNSTSFSSISSSGACTNRIASMDSSSVLKL